MSTGEQRAGFLNKKGGPAELWLVFVNEEVFRLRMSLGYPDKRFLVDLTGGRTTFPFDKREVKTHNCDFY